MVAVNETTNWTEPVRASLAGRTRRPLGESAPSREEWLQLYAGRVLRTWLRQQAPLGLARSYLDQIKKDLAACYDEPLKRMFIETTY